MGEKKTFGKIQPALHNFSLQIGIEEGVNEAHYFFFVCKSTTWVCIQYGVHFLTSNALNKLPVSFHQVYQILVNYHPFEANDGLRIRKNEL